MLFHKAQTTHVRREKLATQRFRVASIPACVALLKHNESTYPDGSLPVAHWGRPTRGRPVLLSSGPVREWRF